jgi:virulence-associated protein VagC
MPSTLITEVINDGPSQVIRIPAEFHLDVETVAIRRNVATGGLTVDPQINPFVVDSWAAFLDDLHESPRDPDFLLVRPMNQPPSERNILFGDD